VVKAVLSPPPPLQPAVVSLLRRDYLLIFIKRLASVKLNLSLFSQYCHLSVCSLLKCFQLLICLQPPTNITKNLVLRKACALYADGMTKTAVKIINCVKHCTRTHTFITMHDLAVSSVTVLPCGEILRHTDVIHILPDFLAVTYNQFN
jgi:hypothetical protein